MADTRKINTTIRVNGKAFGPGQEDELAQTITPEAGQAQIQSGALSGDWQFGDDAPSDEQSELETVKAQLEESRQTVETANETNRSLIETNTDMLNQVQDGRKTIEAGTAENSELRQKLATAQTESETAKSELETAKADIQKASELVAQMHAAALGEVRGPIRGVVEDVEDVRTRAANLETQLQTVQSENEKYEEQIKKLTAELKAAKSKQPQS